MIFSYYIILGLLVHFMARTCTLIGEFLYIPFGRFLYVLLYCLQMFSFDAKTKVYFLDSNDNAHFIGQFSAEEMLQGGEYDVLYRNNAVSFSYNYGIYDENHNPVYHNVTFNLPET